MFGFNKMVQHQGIIHPCYNCTLRSIITPLRVVTSCVAFFVNQCIACSSTKMKKIPKLRNYYDIWNLTTTKYFVLFYQHNCLWLVHIVMTLTWFDFWTNRISRITPQWEHVFQEPQAFSDTVRHEWQAHLPVLLLSKQLHWRFSQVDPVANSVEGQVLPSTPPTSPRPWGGWSRFGGVLVVGL